MTTPRHAEATAKGRYYSHPTTGEALISVTNVLSVGCAKPALVPWAAKIVAEKAMATLPTLVTRARTDRDAAIKDLKREVTVARDKAADLGSRIHALAEAHALGQTLPHEDGDDEAEAYVAQYRKFLDDFDIDLEQHVYATELTVANPTLGYAGTLDLMLRMTFAGFIHDDGKTRTATVPQDDERGLFIVDIKTSATRAATSVYGEYALQLTALRRATEMWLPNDEVEPFPTTDIRGAAVLNLRKNSYALIPVPAEMPEWRAFCGSLELAKWMHGRGHDINGGEYRPITPKGAIKPKRQTRKAA